MTLDELQKLCDEATPGPWRYHDNGFDGGIAFGKATEGSYQPYIFGGEPHEGRIEPDDANAAFVIAARTYLPKLIAVAKAAQAYTDRSDPVISFDKYEGLAEALTALEQP